MSADGTAATPPAVLNGVLLVHASLRQAGAALHVATERFGGATTDPAPLVRLWELFAGHLRFHHEGEDDVIYPLITSRQPDFADLESELRSEHHSLDELLAAGNAAFDRLKSSGDPAHARQAHAVVGELNAAMTNHLEHEERDALPIVASVIGEDEMTEIEKGFVRSIPRSDRGMSLASLDAAAKQHPELHLPPVPKPVLALLALVWRRQYASLVARAGA